MIHCPKCDTEVRKEAVRCPLCGTHLRLRSVFGIGGERLDPVLDPGLSLFEKDEIVFWCVHCFKEFREDQKRCKPCKAALVHGARGSYVVSLLERPVLALGTEVAKGPPRLPRDLVRVRIADDLHVARAWVDELRFMGIESHPGSDALDPFDTPLQVGIYVRAVDRDAATYMLGGFKMKDPLFRPPPKREPTERDTLLASARGHLEIGKFRDAARIASAYPRDAEFVLLAIDALYRAGRIREGIEIGRASMDSATESFDRGRILGSIALGSALAKDGTPFGPGSDLARATIDAAAAVALAPRVLALRKTEIEILEAQGRTEACKAAVRGAGRLNPNLLAMDGTFRDLHLRLSALA